MKCIYCQCDSIKKGTQNTVQKYRCRSCNRYFRGRYRNKKYSEVDEKNIAGLNKEGMGISSIGRYLKIPKTTVMRKLECYAAKLKRPLIKEESESYDVDELKTFVKCRQNEYWLAYGINHRTGAVIDFVTGKRTLETLKPLLIRIKTLNPKRIFTDGLNIYA